jgi:hypothetical protein
MSLYVLLKKPAGEKMKRPLGEFSDSILKQRKRNRDGEETKERYGETEIVRVNEP